MTISFNTKGYDVFIDFIKAYAIMCVLFGHTFLWLDKVGYGVWAGMQVPLFILVQAFHWYKKDKPVINFVKILKRVYQTPITWTKKSNWLSYSRIINWG